MVTVRSEGEAATRSAGRLLARVVSPGDVILLSGDLGAGKTVFVKGLAEGLGIDDPITSPTFNILLVHPGRLPLHHIDLYRLDDASQLEDIDYFGTLEAGGVTAVEWGDRFPEAAPSERLELRIVIASDTVRGIEVAGVGLRGEALAADWFAEIAGRRDAGLGLEL